jgi:hypothetical protein
MEPVQECLLEYHPFKTDPYGLRPCLLTQLPVRTEREGGGISYKCELKSGIFFHDDPCFPGGKGRELEAKDVEFAFQRMADPKVECPVVSTLQDYIEGLGEAFEAARKRGEFDYSKPVAGLRVTGRYSFEIRLKEEYPQLLYWLAMHFTAPVAREAVEYYDGKTHEGVARELFRFHPVATGPFRIAEWKRNTRIRLQRNAAYRTTTFPKEGWEAAQEGLLRPLAGRSLPLAGRRGQRHEPAANAATSPKTRVFCRPPTLVVQPLVLLHVHGLPLQSRARFDAVPQRGVLCEQPRLDLSLVVEALEETDLVTRER